MGKRLDLQKMFFEIAPYVYFQPPPTLDIQYPCIIYSRVDMDEKHADDRLYSKTNLYSVIVIDEDPDSELPEKMIYLPMCRFERHYTADNLNHDVFLIYY